MLRLIPLLFQLQAGAADSIYGTTALREFVARAAAGNRAPPIELRGYQARVETELAFILRDSIGREIVGQLEQLAARADWERSGKYDLHVVGFRSQSLGAPYSALSFTRMYTVPTLYGNRLVLGLNDGMPRRKQDSVRAQKRLTKDTAAGREPLRAIHPLANDRDVYYRFSGGDTVATLYVNDRQVRIARVHVEPVLRKQSNFLAWVGEMDFDADRHQLVRLRGRLRFVSTEKDPKFVRATGAIAEAYVELENAEINGKYWLPNYQRSEFQAQMSMLGDVRPIYRIVSRFRDYALETSDTVLTLADMDTLPMPRTRSKLSFASRDSVSRYSDWRANIGTATGEVGSDDFDDLAPDVWKKTGKPRVDRWPRDMAEVIRYNRVEGMYTGLAASVKFRDAYPGLTARGNIGIGWESQDVRGLASATLQRGKWIQSLRVERTLATTNDFLSFLETGLGIGPIFGVDDHDYVDRWTGAASVTRIIKNVDRALLTTEAAFVADRPEVARLRNSLMDRTPFLPVRPAWSGDYFRGTSRLEWHPSVTGDALSGGVGAILTYEIAAGSLDWQRVEARLAARKYWRGIVFATRVDAGTVLGDSIPPQVMYELGGGYHLPSYGYKEFGGDRAAVGRGVASYQFPVLRTPIRLGPMIIPGLGPGVATSVQSGWAEASTASARNTLALLGGAPTGRVRATADYRLTFLSGAMGVGMARPIDRPARWKPFFVWGAAF